MNKQQLDLLIQELNPQLNQFANRERELNKEIEEWDLIYLQPLVNTCSTIEELNYLYSQLRIVDENNKRQDLPGLLEINKCFAYDRVIYTNTKEVNNES